MDSGERIHFCYHQLSGNYNRTGVYVNNRKRYDTDYDGQYCLWLRKWNGRQPRNGGGPGNGGDMGQKPDDGNGMGKGSGDGGNMGTPPEKVNNHNKEGR